MRMNYWSFDFQQTLKNATNLNISWKPTFFKKLVKISQKQLFEHVCEENFFKILHFFNLSNRKDESSLLQILAVQLRLFGKAETYVEQT